LTTAVIDGDIIAFRCACTLTERDPFDIANWRASTMMNEILMDTGASEYLLFLSGGENFRKTLDPNYKANRADKPRPPALEPVREYLVLDWGAKVTDGIEADDALGINQTDDTIICTIDKDLLQVPGKHYNFVTKEFRTVSSLEALQTFYKQLLLGDRSDNIPGYDGMARQKPTRQIQAWYDEIDRMDAETEMYQLCLDAYSGDVDRLFLTGNLVYIQRKNDDKWQQPQQEKELQLDSTISKQEEATLC